LNVLILKLLSTFTLVLMSNPFCLDEEVAEDDTLPLINISTGVAIPPDVVKRLVQSYKLGTAQIKTFVEQRLNTNDVLFWNVLPNLKIKTFNTVARKRK